MIDEAQRQPDLFPVLRVLVDEDRRPGRFLVLGSASPDLVGLGAESLAGRVAPLELSGFGLRDVGTGALDRLWLRGGLPPGPGETSTSAPSWTMVAHYHGQTWNGAELARSLGVSQPTVRRQLTTTVTPAYTQDRTVPPAGRISNLPGLYT